MWSSLAPRLKALSPPQLAMVALGSLALAGAGTAAAAGLIAGVSARHSPLTGGDQDLGGGRVPNGGLTRPSAETQKIQNTPGTSAAATTARSGSTRSLASAPIPSSVTTAPGSAGPGKASPGAGPKGDTGGAGPQGNTGGAGPTVDAHAGNETGAPGPTGDTGTGGPTGPSGPTGGPAPAKGGDAAPPAPQRAPSTPAASAVFVVKDADGTTAGTLLSADPNADWLMFSYKNRTFTANARTGALDLPAVDTSYATDDCTGTPYAPLSRPAKSVLRSSNPNETGIYEFGQPGSVDVRSIWQTADGGQPDACLQYIYTNTALAPLQQLSADDQPPTLSGPLRSVRAS